MYDENSYIQGHTAVQQLTTFYVQWLNNERAARTAAEARVKELETEIAALKNPAEPNAKQAG